MVYEHTKFKKACTSFRQAVNCRAQIFFPEEVHELDKTVYQVMGNLLVIHPCIIAVHAHRNARFWPEIGVPNILRKQPLL
jgi:hypothetical protein